MNQKLKKLGIDLPFLPVTSVGSFPKPRYLTKARADFNKQRINKELLYSFEQKATDEWLAYQQKAGIDVAVDGEMYRGDMVAFFAENMPGFDKGGLVRSYGNRFYYKPIIVGEVKWPGPMTADWWKYAQSKTDSPVKGMLTGPYTIMDWSFNEHYDDRETAALALADCIRDEVGALIEAGCKIIQIDEPAISVRTDELDAAIETMHRVIDGQEAYFITHICYGTFEKIYPKMLDIPVDNIDLELSNSNLNMLEMFKKHPFTKDITFGVVDSHSHKIEDVEMIKDRIKQALRYIPENQLWIDPDCGFKTRSIEESKDKLDNIMAAVRAFR
ncbi:MAG: methionine synthase [candidate division Zixibacteria bacterium]|nr:methionine synthase [candidate division Zixibacteria bacterium]